LAQVASIRLAPTGGYSRRAINVKIAEIETINGFSEKIRAVYPAGFAEHVLLGIANFIGAI
jgi:hypothetical protein